MVGYFQSIIQRRESSMWRSAGFIRKNRSIRFVVLLAILVLGGVKSGVADEKGFVGLSVGEADYEDVLL